MLSCEYLGAFRGIVFACLVLTTVFCSAISPGSLGQLRLHTPKPPRLQDIANKPDHVLCDITRSFHCRDRPSAVVHQNFDFQLLVGNYGLGSNCQRGQTKYHPTQNHLVLVVACEDRQLPSRTRMAGQQETGGKPVNSWISLCL